MTTLAIGGVSTVMVSDAEILNGAVIPTGTSAAANTTFTFIWSQGVCLYAVGATSNTITLTFVNPVNSALNWTTGSLTAATGYWFGPFSSAFMVGSTGLITFTSTGTITGAKFAVATLPGYTGPSHNPFDPQVSGVTDY